MYVYVVFSVMTWKIITFLFVLKLSKGAACEPC